MRKKEKDRQKRVSFVSTIPIFSLYIAKGMGMVLLIILGIFGLVVVSVVINGGMFSQLTPDIYFALGFVGLIFFFTYLVMWIIFPQGFMYRCTIDTSGVSQVSLSPTKTISRLAVIGGILRRSPGAVGAGLLAEAGDERHLSWDEITIVKINTRNRYCYFSKGRFGLFPIGFICPEKYFKKVQTITQVYQSSSSL